ncbi:hypothetical protein ACGFR8_08120 [Streptomyces brevispora]|uniref:hypothetical protein n=1 Tax=Streptomyces brevispora TaxID=887462 RepID=UPI0037232AAC
MASAVGAIGMAVSLTACGGTEPKAVDEPAVPAAEMQSVKKVEGNADIPNWVTSRTFPTLTYVKYSEYRKATGDDLRGALEHFGGSSPSAADAVEYWEEQGVSSAKEAYFAADVSEGDLKQLCTFALGRLPKRSVVVIRDANTGTEASANTRMGEGDEPGSCA